MQSMSLPMAMTGLPDPHRATHAVGRPASILDTPAEEYVIESSPSVAAILAVVVLLAFMPGTVLWLPNLLM
jgi:hypothetical protein